MGSLFTYFYDKLSWLLNWFYDGFVGLCSVILTGISFLLFVLVGYLLKILGWLLFALTYVVDLFLVQVVGLLGWFAGSDGIFAKFGIMTATMPTRRAAIITIKAKIII